MGLGEYNGCNRCKKREWATLCLTNRRFGLKIVFASGMVGIAQLVRAPGCGPGGHGFNSHYSPQQVR